MKMKNNIWASELESYQSGLLLVSMNFMLHGTCFSLRVSKTLWLKGPAQRCVQYIKLYFIHYIKMLEMHQYTTNCLTKEDEIKIDENKKFKIE